MTSLRPNLVKRIERLPKPTNVAGAMQPLFEAISNAIHSTQARFGDAVSTSGRVVVTVSTDRKKENVWATVEDNGVGLDAKNWDAFTTTDTDNKIQSGGKGVGRLLWLDCFNGITVDSVFESDGGYARRKFDFVLATAMGSKHTCPGISSPAPGSSGFYGRTWEEEQREAAHQPS